MRYEHAPQAFAAAAATLLLAGLLISAAFAQEAPGLPRAGNAPDAGITTGPVPDDPKADPGFTDPQGEDDEAKPDDPSADQYAPGERLPKEAAPAPQAPDPNAPGSAQEKQKAAEAPKDKEALLAELYAHLAKAPDAEQAAEISKTIEGLWLHSGSDTIGVLMRRGIKAVNEQHNDLALKMFDAVVELAPDYAEGWSRRAFVYCLQNDTEHAVGDLRRALALDPNHYKALDGLARILRDGGQKKSALRAYQELLRINPYADGAKQAERELSVEVEGQGI
jgi:tetratricopeptide (TPR) repeat protein